MPRMKVKEIKHNDDLGQNEAYMTVTNDAVTFLQEAVNMYIQRGFGDIDDPTLQAIKAEVKQDLIDAHNLLNPS